MDWTAVIDRNREALRRVLAALIAMARRGETRPLAEPGDRPSPLPTLPRHLHRAVLRLLRPAESAARRLVVVAARDIVVTLPPPRPRKLGADHAVLRALGIAIVGSASESGVPARRTRARTSRRYRFPLVDPLRRQAPRRRSCEPHAAPRILFPGMLAPHRLPPPPSLHDPIDATRLAQRLLAVGAVLDDLPGHALRQARWFARRRRERARGRAVRVGALRPGRAPGWRRAPDHEIFAVLADMQHFARHAQPDTS